jgi:hypothetical protein
VQVYDFQGKLLCAPRRAGLPHDALTPAAAALAPDTVALLHPVSRTAVHFFAVPGGEERADCLRIRREDDPRRLVSDGNVAVMEIVSIALSQCGSQALPPPPAARCSFCA